MATIVQPVLKAVYLCDEVLAGPKRGKFHLLGALDAFRPTTTHPPFVLERLCVVAQFSGGAGEIPMWVEVADSHSGAVIFTSKVHRVEFSTRHATVFACFRLRNLRFAHAGVYFVELYCGGEFIDDRRLQVLDKLEEEP